MMTAFIYGSFFSLSLFYFNKKLSAIRKEFKFRIIWRVTRIIQEVIMIIIPCNSTLSRAHSSVRRPAQEIWGLL